MHTRQTLGMPARAGTGLQTPIAGLLILTLAACSQSDPAPEPVRSVRTLTVVAGEVGGTVDYAGEVRARVESRLGFRVGGKMVSRPANLGEPVRVGQVLASLDAQDLRLSQDAARASVQVARTSHEQAETDFKRFKELREQGFISAAEVERRESTMKASRAQFDQALAIAGVQTNQARYSTLVADANGVVTAVEAEPGAVLSAGATVLRVAQDGPRDVVFSVPEDQAGALRALQGQAGALSVRLWGTDTATLPAAVREVAPAADAVTRTFLVKADIGKSTVSLGRTATVSLVLPPVPGKIKLPLSAVFEQHGKSTVWVFDKVTMTVRAQPIQVLAAEGNLLVVGSGLTPGQQVVSAGVHVLIPGQRVALYGVPPPGEATAASAAAR